MSVPVIGVICDDTPTVLPGCIAEVGYRVITLLSDELVEGELPQASAWVVDCEDTSPVADALGWIDQQLLILSNRPDPADQRDYGDWCDRIIATLDKWSADFWQGNRVETVTQSRAYADVEAIWVIGGSTGGVSAVASFLGAFTHVPPVAFVYAQHIAADQQELLVAVGHANQDLTCSLAVGRHWLNPGHVLIVPAACRLQFSQQGEVFSVRDPWGTSETPSIDQLMMDMSGIHPSPAGAILFSGAGKDGCEGLRALKAVGARIWVQDPATAVSPSMPQTAIEHGVVDYNAAPTQLAALFMGLYPPK